MDPAFEKAIATVLAHEGGYVDHPDDPGGATNHGISLRFLRSLKKAEGDIDRNGVVNAADIQGMSVERAKALYHRHWWRRFRYAELPDPIATKVLDLSIWMGPGRAHRLLQTALWAAGHKVGIDGGIGPETLGAVARVDPQVLICPLRSEAAGFLRLLVCRRPSSETFLKGWLRRAYS